MTVIAVLDDILRSDRLTTRFQPIVDVCDFGAGVFAYEGLTRGPEETHLADATTLFQYARQHGKEQLLDSVCVSNILSEAAKLPPDVIISINVHASTLASGDRFLLFVADCCGIHGIDPARLIIEVCDHGARLGEPLIRSLKALKELGVRIALDDFAGDAADVAMLGACVVDYVKIDRALVQGVAGDDHQLAVIEALQTRAVACGASVIAEGVENAEDLEALRAAGISLFQGYLFSEALPAERYCPQSTWRGAIASMSVY